MYSDREYDQDQDKLDIVEALLDFVYAVKKLWWLVLILVVAFAGKEALSTTISHVESYTAEATVSVASSTGSTAEELGKLFPYMQQNGMLEDVLLEVLETETIQGTISMEADEDTDFLTISVSSSDPEMAYEILKSVIETYPQVVEFVIGNTKLTILDESGVPEAVEKSEIYRGSIANGASQGAMIGFGILVIYAFTRRTVKSKKQLKRQINLMDCGSLPYIPVKKRKNAARHNEINLLEERISPGYVEAIRKIRTKVLRDMEAKEYKSILVTSSIPGEGKTTVAANLALSMAQQGKRVVLLDCDMRNPSVAAAMNEKEEHPGLAAVLKKSVPVSEAMTEVKLPKGELLVLYGKEGDASDASLLGSERMNSLIRYWKKRADFVILDTAPSGLLADAPMLAKYADAALYVVRYDHTKLSKIREGLQSLAMSGVHMLGYVFNGDKSEGSQAYGYGYSYGRYSRYGSYGSYGRYGRYGSYGRRGDKETGVDEDGRVFKD